MDELERQVVDSTPFQRLKRIKQLSTTHYLYPGAMHTRFEHSVGTMHLATIAFDTLVAKGGSGFLAAMGWSTEREAERARQILRLGALLHDVGHSPFSHGPEALFRDGARHENYTKRLIEEGEIQSVLAGSRLFSIPVEDVVYVAVGPRLQTPPKDVGIRFLGELVFGDLGADRIDYLNRDSLHLGVQYGRFDYARLLNTLTVTEHHGDPVLAIEAGGVHAAESLLLARYFMFTQVYYHPIRVIYDRHLTDFIKAYLEERHGGYFPAELPAYIALTDVEIEEVMQRDSEPWARISEPLRRRTHYRLAREVHPDELAANPALFDKLEESVVNEFGNDVRVDAPTKETHSLKTGDLLVVDDGEVVDILVRSELIQRLPPTIWRGRVYAKKEREEEVSKFVDSLIKSQESSDAE
ncbi:MAG: HD domain-containing protein [Chloroflexota bacterium]|nr:HD domain-containing protein [Chloroflexota bacterium]